MKKIFVHLIDGSEAHVPVEAEEIENDRYLILEDKEYSDLDTTQLFEFYPGDIVDGALKKASDGKTFLAASKLVHEGKWSNRQYFDFQFQAVEGKLKINKATADKYSQEAERIIREKSAGQYFYPKVLETAEKIVQLTKTS